MNRQRRLLRPAIIVLAAFVTSLPSFAAQPPRIFLTFDDGPTDATIRVLDVLAANQVKATFFVNGIHLDSGSRENEGRAAEALLRMILEGHVVANHGYDHMRHNQSANAIPSSVNAFRDVVRDSEDFVPRNTSAVNKVLGPLQSASNNRVATLGRLPYSNNWQTDSMTIVCRCCTTDDFPSWDPRTRCGASQSISNSALSAAEVVDQLYARVGMKFFGWDVEWGPSSWDQVHVSEHMVSIGGLADLVARALDRPVCSATEFDTVWPCINPGMHAKVIILTHEFLFEDGDRGCGEKLNVPLLDMFIKLMKSKGYVFETLDDYDR